MVSRDRVLGVEGKRARALVAGAMSLITMVGVFAIAERRAFASGDIVLYASDVTRIQGNWAATVSSSAAGGQMLASADNGWSTASNALASPADYVEATFSAPAFTPYHVWLRLRAAGNSKFNDSVWVQFSDALDLNQTGVYQIGSTRGLLVNLENCTGCGVSGWGWQDKASWLQQVSTIQFSASGPHTIRIQTREDGVQFDQVVLSPASYLNSSPGQVTNDTTIVPKSSTTTATTTTTTITTSTPYSGSPAPLPGQVNAETFDNGGEGVSYHDTSSGNNGGQARATDVDIETSADGGYDIGWTASGEWVNYSVNAATAGSYTLQLRVASPNGATMHIGFNGPSSVWTAVTIPATGGWQAWTTVSVPVTLGAGVQTMTVSFDTGGMNFRYAKVVSNAAVTAPTPAPSSSGAYSGTPAAIPGRIEAEMFDNGGEGVAYHDTSAGNNGGQFRSTDVDIEVSADGGYDIGWTAPGEWLNYSVNVASAGSYTAQVRVASPNGATMHIGLNAPSNVWTSVAIPATGGWQSWTTVNVPVALGAGLQQMTILFDTGGMNLTYVNVVAGATAATAPPPTSSTASELVVATWNVQVDDSSAAHARTVMDYLAALSPQPQVVVLTEVRGTQYNTYLNELQNRTSYAWQGVFLPECPPGAWSGSSCTTSEDEGTAILTMLPVAGSSTTYLPYADAWHSARALVRLAVNLNGVVTQVFGTHLQVNNATARNSSMAYLKNYAGNFPSPQIVGGDFNADPDQIDTTSGMLPNFVDSWFVVNSTRGLTASTPSPTSKLDYLFTDASGKVTTNWSSVVTGTGTVSDHFPVHASFGVRP